MQNLEYILRDFGLSSYYAFFVHFERFREVGAILQYETDVIMISKNQSTSDVILRMIHRP